MTTIDRVQAENLRLRVAHNNLVAEIHRLRAAIAKRDAVIDEMCAGVKSLLFDTGNVDKVPIDKDLTPNKVGGNPCGV